MSKVLVLLLVLILFTITGGTLFYFANIGPVSTDTTTKIFVINSGDGVASISRRLESLDLIRNRYVFISESYRLGLSAKLKAGTFRLAPSLSTAELIQKISSGGSHDYWLKIIEGTRIEEIANRLPVESGISSRDFIAKSGAKEGQLFPDSYLIPQEYSLAQILDIINNNFTKKLNLAKVDATTTSLSDSEIVILASLLEREARTLKSKQAVAGILLNRLSAGMALQVDATVQYVRDSKTINKVDKVFWKPITKSDLGLVSPFNTYLHPGLPPSPICNPGYDSLYAAYHPTESDYIYYITGNDDQMHFAKTLDEHNSNILKFLK